MLNNISKNANSSDTSGYRAREMAEKARKDREDKQRKLVLQKRQLELKEMDLRMQEDKYSALRREITKLESRSQNPVGGSALIADIGNLERQNTAKIAEDERKIKALEQEMVELDRTSLSRRTALIAQKEQEEKQDLRHIEEIKLELRKAEEEDSKLRQEISMLKNQKGLEPQNAQKVLEGKANIERLKREVSSLDQDLSVKKQQAEKASKDLAGNHERLLQEKTQEAILAANRIKGIKEEIKMIQDRILMLQK